jgi:probable F420-dependent oxidoreductase
MPEAPGVGRLGFYTLGGHVESPRDMLAELRLAEEQGLGNAFISERLNVKEACALSGAAGAVTERIDITTGATNISTRHPAISAAFATTMHRLTGGRFVFGIGRGLRPQIAGLGLSQTTTAEMADFAGLMRRLWRGETVVDHDGPLGRFPRLALNPTFDEHIRLGITAFGDRTLELAGRAFDVVVLHTFFADETVRHCVRTVREAAERAGRDPASVAVWSCYATLVDEIDPGRALLKSVGRLATYLQVYGDLLVATNGWDPAALARFRASEVVGELTGWADATATPAQLERLAGVLPDEWLGVAATGGAEACARAVRRQFDLGVDGVIMHGATPTELAPVVAAYRAGSATTR